MDPGLNEPGRETTRLIKEQRFDEAIALQAALLKQEPLNPALHHEMSYLLRAVRNPAAALGHELRACELAPEKLEYRKVAARLYAILGDVVNARRIAAEIAALEEQRRSDFRAAQEKERARFAQLIQSISAERLASWPYLIQKGLETRLADALFETHIFDSVSKWRQFVPVRYGLGDVANVERVGKFVIDSLVDTHQKRFVRGMAWELPILALLLELATRCNPSASLIDVGANVGAHTVPIAREFHGRVIAFEPVADTAKRLQEHLIINGVENCLVVQKACSAVPGIGRMLGYRAENSGRARLEFAIEGSVEITTLDCEAERLGLPVAIIKIDVEGHELSVIEGAISTIRRYRPIVICELLNKPSLVPKLMDELRYHGLHIYRSDWAFFPE